MKNIKIIFRHLFYRKLSTSFVLISFTLAFCCTTLICLFVTDEFAFDRHNTNFRQIYRLNIQAKDKNIISCNFPGIFYESINKVPGIEKYARLQTFLGERFITVNNKTEAATSFLFGDPEILDILDFNFLMGNPKTALADPFNVLISQSTAKKYFGDENPLGKTIKQDHYDFTVSGVVKDLPEQSHITMNFLAPISSYKTINNNLISKWYISTFNYYFLLPEKANKAEIEPQLAKLFAEGNGISEDKREFEMRFEPLGDIHLRSVATRWDNALKGDIKVVYGLIVIGLLILGIAIANYINILTADYRRKIKEINIRKLNGASERAIIFDQLTETFLLFSLAIVLSALLAYLLLPFIKNLSEKSLTINSTVLILDSLLLFFSTLLSVIYPVVFLKSFKSSDALKNNTNILNFKGQQKQQWIRGLLVTFQLVTATILIIATIVINKQLQLVLKTKTGFDQENTLIVTNPYSEGMNDRYDLFKEKLTHLPMVKKVGVAQNAPTGYINNFSPAWLPGHENEEKLNMGQITVDYDFFDAVGATFVEGRNFDINYMADKTSGIVINQSAVKKLNLVHPVGSKIVVQNNASTPNNELNVIGVIKDMQYFTLKEAAKPVMYYIRDWSKHNIVVKLGKGNYSSTLKQMEHAWKETSPEWPFSYQFMDDRISANYKSEINTSKIIFGLSGISIFLSILGILGMIIFTIQRRTKEIGIRKVNGAKTHEIMAMLNKDFAKWVAIAFVIACPIAWYAMHKWLENFAYKTELSWWIFALAGCIALGIALLTVSFQSWRAATRNPVESLRYE